MIWKKTRRFWAGVAALSALIVATAALPGLSADDESQKAAAESAQKQDAAKEENLTLTEELEQMNARFQKMAPEEKRKEYQKAIENLRKTGIEENSLKVGDKAPAIELPNANGEIVKVSDLLKKGPVIVAFYRGGWCPYCNLELRAYQKSLPEFKKRGAQLVAISPQTPDNSLDTIEKHSLEFEVLTDKGNKTAAAFGIVFELPENIKEAYKAFGADLAKWNDEDSYKLPLAATYVIDRKGVIRYAFVDADYKKRADPLEIIDAIGEIEK